VKAFERQLIALYLPLLGTAVS